MLVLFLGPKVPRTWGNSLVSTMTGLPDATTRSLLNERISFAFPLSIVELLQAVGPIRLFKIFEVMGKTFV